MQALASRVQPAHTSGCRSIKAAFSRAGVSSTRVSAMPSATWHGVTLAEGTAGAMVEGNLYFKPDQVKMEYLQPSSTTTVVVVDGETLKDAVWHYPETKKAADHIKGHFAFWKGVKVSSG